MMTDEPITPQAASKLGEYTVIRDIADGTFGQVKSNEQSPYLTLLTYPLSISGHSYDYWSACRHEIHPEKSNKS